MFLNRPPRPSTSEQKALESHAIENLRVIRETMERAGSFTAVPGWGTMTIGATALLAAMVASWQPSTEAWFTTWIIEAGIALSIGLWTMARKARRAQVPLLSGPGRNFALSLSPPILAAAFLTIVLFQVGQESVIPGMWLLLYGTAIVTAGTYSVRIVPVMGLSFIVIGVVTLFSPAGLVDWLMASGFGGLHLVFGFIIARRYSG